MEGREQELVWWRTFHGRWASAGGAELRFDQRCHWLAAAGHGQGQTRGSAVLGKRVPFLASFSRADPGMAGAGTVLPVFTLLLLRGFLTRPPGAECVLQSQEEAPLTGEDVSSWPPPP